MSPAPGPSSPIIGGPSLNASNSTASNTVAGPSTSLVDLREEVITSSGGPKTCTRCGRHIESSDLTSDDAATRAVPSPSSVAFAADTSTTSQISSVLSGSQPSGPDTVTLDEDGHQICSFCAANVRATESGSLLPHTSSRERRMRLRLPLAQQNGESVREEDADTTMTMEVDQGDAGRVADTSTRTRDPSNHPWRWAPWAPGMGEPARSTNNVASSGPLSISVAGIGAGGDAEMRSASNIDDFPPLPRSPQASQSAQSPRLPVSPPRLRSTTSPPTTPSSLARRTSFSRSQTGPTISTASASPIVNFPSRGRNRAGSSSSSNNTGMAAAPHLGRGPSSQRRLSRSNSSQGPTTTAFAEGAAAVVSVDDERIEEDPFGPSAMTRPRLSTLTALELANSATSNTVLRDLYERPSHSSREVQEKVEEEAKRLLTWFRFDQPDPRRDISKLRCTSRGRGCLFPGSIFNGTQKSGRMSYDVTVQIVNVDMASSHLCGYLNIRGLTDDWPELTTYFDAEIIGMRYGFITGKWGAMEADDMKHWSRFAPFRPLKNSLIKPGLRFNHMNKPFVFMRWKERFLVPDHRVRDINGASFAGFYYVCVELGEDEPGQSSQPLMPPLSPTITGSTPPPPLPHHPRQRSASIRRQAASNTSIPAISTEESQAEVVAGTAEAAAPEVTMEATESSPNVPTMGRMSGFYFHEHSEPYQQLTLQHVTEKFSPTFELR